MAANIKNGPTPTTKIVRGSPRNLGTITAVNDVVQFSIPSDTFYNQGGMTIMVASGITGGTYKLECSLDGTNSWFDFVLPTASTTADFGDTAASVGYPPINVSGFGGATFRFGLSAVTSGSAAVWVLLG